jgi:hypothetical protein
MIETAPLASGIPPVHPDLVAHLRKVFPLEVARYRETRTGDSHAERCLVTMVAYEGAASVIDYLASLLPTEQENPNVVHEAEGEYAGPDPRRPSSRGRS